MAIENNIKNTAKLPTETPSVKSSTNIRSLKTYLTDVQTAIQEQKESVAKIALAERERREANKEKEPARREFSSQQRKILMVAGSIFGIFVLLGGAFGAIRFFNIEIKTS